MTTRKDPFSVEVKAVRSILVGSIIVLGVSAKKSSQPAMQHRFLLVELEFGAYKNDCSLKIASVQ